MSNNAHSYFSNHTQTRLHNNTTTQTSTVTPSSNSSSTASTISATGGASTNGHTSSNGTTSRPRSHTSTSVTLSKHFSLSVSGGAEKEKEKSTSTGERSSSSEPSKTVHPLRCTWVLWFRQHRPGATKVTNYEEGIRKIAPFSSVESFWSIWTHLNPPSTVQPTTDYLLFLSSVRRPVWEDPLNISGGKWILRLRKGVADRLWEDLVLGVIGEQFDEEDEICGCVLSVRSQEDILSVWNRDEKDSVACNRIRDTIKRLLNLNQATNMEYKSNNDSLQDKSSFRTNHTERT